MARQYHSAAQGGSDITVISNVTWVDAVELAFTPDASTSYYLFFSGLIGNSVATSDIQYRVLEGANVIATGNIEPKDTAPQEYRSFAGFLRHQEGGSPSARSFKIQIKLETSGSTGRIRSARLTAIRHETGDVFEETTTAYTTGNAAGAVIESISTSSQIDYTTDDYIIFGSAKLQAGTAGATIEIDLERPYEQAPPDNPAVGRAYAMQEYSDTTSAMHVMLGFHVNANEDHNLSDGSLQMTVDTPSGTTSVSDRRILALKVTGDNVYAAYDQTGNGAGQSGTTYADAYTFSPSVNVAGDHFAFLSLGWNSDSTSVSSYSDFTIAGTVISEEVKEFNGDLSTHAMAGVVNLAAGTNAIKARSKGETGTPTQFLYEISFVIWQLAAPKARPFRRRATRFFQRRF